VLQDGEFCLAESHSIARYLHAKYSPKNGLFLDDPVKNARINMYLDFHLGGTRRISGWLFNQMFAPMLGRPASPLIEEYRTEAERVLRFLDTKMLKDSPYLANGEFSFADVSAYCEIVQLKFMDYDFKQYENLAKWLARVGAVPEVRQGHEKFDKLAAAFVAKSKAKL
jgi:glutathione S-transferase